MEPILEDQVPHKANAWDQNWGSEHKANRYLTNGEITTRLQACGREPAGDLPGQLEFTIIAPIYPA